ncbi:MAG TPA: fumarylacetoacetase [Blastocatellia bacterium]|nr:fumarylacetoacetase [Blastocatellia bacterium]
MAYSINETHDPNLKSWVESANDPTGDFPIQNLPFGIFTRPESEELPCIGVAIGDQILDLAAVADEFWSLDFTDDIGDACSYESLDMMMTLEPESMSELRRRVSKLLRADNFSDERYIVEDFLIPMDEVEMLLPINIGDYTDFYASIFHATNVGKMFRPDNPLMPNYKWVPIGYHGRASSVMLSGTPVYRPTGQTKDDQAETPSVGPSRMLDYELEVGILIGSGNRPGATIRITEAEDHIFGLCLVNDWSARDLQRWEYQPLGPFLSKSFATTISPWIITMEALAPFRAPAFKRPAGDPDPLPYLDSLRNRERGGFDIKLEVYLSTPEMRNRHLAPHRLTGDSNTKDLYWTFAQMVTHHAGNGCNLRPGDLIASGTVSGATKESLGCLLELTQRGTEPIQLPTGEVRRFLQDEDEVILRGYCERDGFRRIGFGECLGRIGLPK